MDLNPNLVRFVVCYAIGASILYLIFKRAKLYEIHRIKIKQPNSEDRESCEGKLSDTVVARKTNLLNWDTFIKIYYYSSITWNFVMVIKYSLICLLDMGALNDYRYLDCFLIGRVACNSRIVGLLKYSAFCACFFHVIQHFILLRRGTSFKIPCLEFLLMSPDEITKFHRQSYSSVQLRTIKESQDESVKSRQYKGSQGRATDEWYSNRVKINDANKMRTFDYCSLLIYKNYLIDSPESDHEQVPALSCIYNIRPNRSINAWRWYARILVTWLAILMGSFAILILPFWAMAAPMIVTKPGFEANYRVCLKWISEQEDRSRWQYIYDVPRNFSLMSQSWRRVFFLSLFEDNWVTFSTYHIIRCSWEVCENIIFQFQLCNALLLYAFASILIVADICYYSNQIRAKLEQIISDYNETERLHAAFRLCRSRLNYNGIKKNESYSHLSRLSDSRQANTKQRYNLDSRIADLQAMLLDMFKLIKDYNSYTVYFVCYAVFAWYTFLLVCSSWLFIPSGKQETTTIESNIIQGTATAVVIVIMSAYSIAGTTCAKLYELISTAASLHKLSVNSRHRWMVILKHYRPVPLYCFSIFRTSELSWMFALKVVAWIFSALFILSSFSLYMRVDVNQARLS